MKEACDCVDIASILHIVREEKLYAIASYYKHFDIAYQYFIEASIPSVILFYSGMFPLRLLNMLSHRVCVVCLAPNHPLLTNPQPEITSISFNVGNVDRTNNKVCGKRKNKFSFVKVCSIYLAILILYKVHKYYHLLQHCVWFIVYLV